LRDTTLDGGVKLKGVDLSGEDLRGANLSEAQLSDSDLSDADLRDSTLTEAQMEEAELWYANMTNADLSKANLKRSQMQGADLTDTILHEANLQGANLRSTRGLQVQQLGRTNVSNAQLPKDLAKFEGLETIDQASRSARRLFVTILVVVVYSLLTTLSNPDVEGMSRLPVIGVEISSEALYLIVPLLLVLMNGYFHIQMQRIWDEMIRLPSIFPDGKTIDLKVRPWLITGMSRFYIFRIDGDSPEFFKDRLQPFFRLQWWLAVSSGWCLIPFTILIMLSANLTGFISLSYFPTNLAISIFLIISISTSFLFFFTAKYTLSEVGDTKISLYLYSQLGYFAFEVFILSILSVVIFASLFF